MLCQQCGLAGQLSMMVTLRLVGTCKSGLLLYVMSIQPP